MEKLLVTGEPGMGKSTLITRIKKEYTSQIVGIVSPEIRDTEAKRVGFSSGPFENPNMFTIAHVEMNSSLRLGRYGISIENLDQIAGLLTVQLQQAKQTHGVLVFDEIGLMQESSEKLRRGIEGLLESNIPAILTIKKDDSKSVWLRELKTKSGLRIIRLHPENREAMFSELSRYIEEAQVNFA